MSGPAQVTRAVPAPGNVPSPAVFPRRRTPILRPLPLNIIVIISHRAIVDPCHQLHLGRLQTASHRPVIMREDERAPIGRVIPTSSDGMCSCLPKSPSLLRREPSLWENHLFAGPADSCWISPRSSSPGTSDGRPGRRRAGYSSSPGTVLVLVLVVNRQVRQPLPDCPPRTRQHADVGGGVRAMILRSADTWRN